MLLRNKPEGHVKVKQPLEDEARNTIKRVLKTTRQQEMKKLETNKEPHKMSK